MFADSLSAHRYLPMLDGSIFTSSGKPGVGEISELGERTIIDATQSHAVDS